MLKRHTVVPGLRILGRNVAGGPAFESHYFLCIQGPLNSQYCTYLYTCRLLEVCQWAKKEDLGVSDPKMRMRPDTRTQRSTFLQWNTCKLRLRCEGFVCTPGLLTAAKEHEGTFWNSGTFEYFTLLIFAYSV